MRHISLCVISELAVAVKSSNVQASFSESLSRRGKCLFCGGGGIKGKYTVLKVRQWPVRKGEEELHFLSNCACRKL